MNKKIQHTLTVLSVAAITGTGLVTETPAVEVHAASKTSLSQADALLVNDIQKRIEVAGKNKNLDLLNYASKDISKVKDVLAQKSLKDLHQRNLNLVVEQNVRNAFNQLMVSPDFLTADTIKTLEMSISATDVQTRSKLSPYIQRLKSQKARHFFKTEENRLKGTSKNYTYSTADVARNSNDLLSDYKAYGYEVANRMKDRKTESLYTNNILLLRLTKDAQLKKETVSLIAGHSQSSFRSFAGKEIQSVTSGSPVVNVPKVMSIQLQNSTLSKVFTQTVTPRGKELVQQGFSEMERGKAGSSNERKKLFSGALLLSDLSYYASQNRFQSEDEAVRAKLLVREAQSVFGIGLKEYSYMEQMEADFYKAMVAQGAYKTLPDLDRALFFAKKTHDGNVLKYQMAKDKFLYTEALAYVDFYNNTGRKSADKPLVEGKIKLISDANMKDGLWKSMQ